MSHTRQALEALRATVQLLGRSVKLPEMPGSAQALVALAAGDAAPALPAGDVLEAVRRRLQQAARSPQRWDGAAPRDLRDAPWLMWADKALLAALDGLLEAVLRLAERRAGVRRTLIEGWLKGFAPDGPRMAEAGRAIRRLITGNADARLQPWRLADSWCHLFDAVKGPKTLALQILQGTDPVPALLARACLDDPLRAVSGYMRAVQHEVLQLAPDCIAGTAGPAAMARLTDFLAPDGQLRFSEPEACGNLARSLLAPWINGRRLPDEAVRAAVQSFLLTHLRDPRLHPERWAKAGDTVVAVMRQWLARASLNAFFEVIGEYAYDKQWRYREAFWSACLEAGGIDDAWLALGAAVHTSARSVRELNGGFARLRGNGDQSVLLLRVKNTVFSEWSHNGKLRAWPLDWKTAPKLYLREYSRSDVIGTCLPFPPNPQYGSNGNRDSSGLSHVGSDSSRWQGSVARMLADRAGIHLTHRDWMPK
ncbi:MAG: EH signature domain-containing protein [Alphaproteobacteria bacterium]